MKRYRLSAVPDTREGHFLRAWVEGIRIAQGGLSFHPPGFRTHPEGHHVHEYPEVFCILQGRGVLELNEERIPVQVGDVLIIEPGEEHHLVSSEEDPLINLWFHADERGHPKQYPL
ncbi:MAG TPA: cupin domain-containing protein [Armatimonadetes bacterium]|nr:cupin domain-containing protein [Armatimonadota bacterium]